jgi:hypothetical protein
LFIRGDDDLDFGQVIRVINAANETRLNITVGLFTAKVGGAGV